MRIGVATSLVAVGAAVLVMTSATRAHADSKADVLFNEARTLQEAGKYQEACQKFEEVMKLDADAVGAMINLGKCHEKQGHLVLALKWYRDAHEHAEHYHQKEYQDAANEGIQLVEPRVPVIRIEFVTPLPADGSVVVDGAALAGDDEARFLVDPGVHTVEIREPHKRAVMRIVGQDETTGPVKIQLAEGGERTIQLKRFEDAHPVVVDHGKARRKLAYEAAGAAVALYAVDLGFGLYYRSQYFDVCPHDQCGGDARSKANSFDTRAAVITTTAFGLGVIATGIAGYLYFTAPKAEVMEAIAPIVGTDHVGLAYSGRF
jgi:tetratricopeptide (TPR) repeat protein